MGKIKPLRKKCANNWCKTPVTIGENLCRKHYNEKINAIKRKVMYA